MAVCLLPLKEGREAVIVVVLVLPLLILAAAAAPVAIAVLVADIRVLGALLLALLAAFL